MTRPLLLFFDLLLIRLLVFTLLDKLLLVLIRADGKSSITLERLIKIGLIHIVTGLADSTDIFGRPLLFPMLASF